MKLQAWDGESKTPLREGKPGNLAEATNPEAIFAKNHDFHKKLSGNIGFLGENRKAWEERWMRRWPISKTSFKNLYGINGIGRIFGQIRTTADSC